MYSAAIAAHDSALPPMVSWHWKNTFTVVLKDKSDKVENYNYSVREVTKVSETALAGWQEAVLENDGTSILYYEKAAETGELVGVTGSGYMVYYNVDDDGVLTVTNAHAVELPVTGGAGTYSYTFGGLFLVAASLMYYFGFQRKRRKGGR